MDLYRTEELLPPSPGTNEDGEGTPFPELDPPPPGTIRFIDIHVYDQPAEEEEEDPSIEGTLDPSAPPAAAPSMQDNEGQSTPQRSRWEIPLLPAILAIVCLALIVVIMAVLVILPLFAPSATITIIPVSKAVSTTAVITVTNGATTSAPGLLVGRALPSVTMSQATTFQTTGTAHQDAQAGSGLVIFYNAAPYAQTVAAGTVLTGASGTQIVTDLDATIPAAAYPQFGQATITAHAAATGPGGNISAGDIYGPCCRLNISAVNTAFHGGQKARSYHTVAKQDITSATASLSANLQQSVQAALQTQVQPSETLVTPLSCAQSVTPEHPVGTEAKEDRVTVSETCVGMAYSTQRYQQLTGAILAQAAQKHLGAGYMLTTPEQSIMTGVTTKHGTLTLHVRLTGTYAYQLGQEQQAHLKALIVRKSKEQATATLLTLPGIQSVSITTRNGDRLPADTTHMQVIFVVMS